jgi:alkylation response protein AidB-like acyl-CoA dehydrogenase
MNMPLPEALRVVEETSRCDGSTGWTVALGFANEFFTSAISQEAAAEVLNGGSALVSGAPGPGVRAVPVDGGFRLSGQWQFNSGCANADWCGVAAVVFDGDGPRMGQFGPEMVFAFLPQRDVEIVDTWHVTGLRGTSSHDLRVDNQFVPAERTGPFSLVTGLKPRRESVLARFPLFTAIGLTQSVPVSLGIARHALEEFRDLVLQKETMSGAVRDQVQVQVGLARGEALLQSGRTWWYQLVEDAWETVRCGGQLTLQDRARLKMASLTAVENCCEAVDTAFRLAGSSAIYQSNALERCWRDVHTAAQHLQVQEGRWQTAGRILLRMEPESLFI